MSVAVHQHAEIARRYKAKQSQKPRVSITSLRINELNRLFTARYGHSLPDDDAGRDDIVVMAHHLARCAGEVGRRIRNWIELRAALDDFRRGRGDHPRRDGQSVQLAG